MKENFKEELLRIPPSKLFSKWILNRIPFIFNNDIELFINWKETLSHKISVDSQAILFTGSSCNGFSLSPWKYFKDYDEKSDIDIAIISEYFFDVCWFELRNLGTEYHKLTPKQKRSFEDHRTRLIYWGTIATDKLLPIFSFGKRWVIALEEMSKILPTEDKEINIRIYKNFESLREYYKDGFKKLQRSLLEEQFSTTTILKEEE